MSHTVYFDINMDTDIKALVEKIQSEILKRKGSVEGDEKEGSVILPAPIGAVHADYKVLDGQLELTINKKPFIVPYSKIESEIKRLIKEYVV